MKCKITYTYKYKSKNYIYYVCSLRNKCNGKGKIDINTYEFYVTQKCDATVPHEKITYQEFEELIKDNDLKKIDFTDFKIQKYFAYNMINNNNNITNPELKNLFYTKYKTTFKLSYSNISHIRTNILNNFKNLDLTSLINKIEISDLNIEKYILDVKYDYKIKNNNIENRKQRIIIFGIEEKLKLLDEKNSKQYFLDNTFKIIPPHFRPYKLFIISALPLEAKKPELVCFILIKYNDEMAYDKIFSYLHENFNFTPKIIMSDFEKAIHSGLKNNKYFKNIVIHIKCFFHFTKMIRNQLMKSGLCNRKLNKYSLEIIRNIQILCFIEKNNINKYKELIINKIKNNDKLTSFIKYLKNYIYKIDPSIYNYADFIKINNNIIIYNLKY